MRQRSSNPFLPFVLPKTALAKAFQTLLNQKDEVSNPGTVSVVEHGPEF